jgi:hypothetical protein
MEWIAVHAFVIAFWAGVFWGSIRIVDGANAKNSFGLAVVLAAIFDFTHLAGIPDLVYLLAWLLFLTRLVMWHYELGLGGGLVITGVTVLAPFFAMPVMLRLVGDSELRAYLLLYGLPIAVFGTWIVSIVRSRLPHEATPTSPLPQARVERGGRRAKRAAPTPVAPKPSVSVVASKPPAPRPDRAPGEPTLLG